MPDLDKPVFVDEVPSKVSKTLVGFAKLAPMLADKPDKWAKVAVKTKKNNITQYRYNFPDFEFTARTDMQNPTSQDEVFDIYARYKGAEWAAENLRIARERREEREFNKLVKEEANAPEEY